MLAQNPIHARRRRESQRARSAERGAVKSTSSPCCLTRSTYRHQGGIVNHDQHHDPSTCVDCISQTAYEKGYAACWDDTLNTVLTLADREGPLRAIRWLRQESEAQV